MTAEYPAPPTTKRGLSAAFMRALSDRGLLYPLLERVKADSALTSVRVNEESRSPILIRCQGE